MRRKTFLAFLCTLKFGVVVVLATCTVNKYEEGFGDRIKCMNTSLTEAISHNSTVVAAVVIFQSYIPYINAQAFMVHHKSLVTLNMYDCGIRQINENAFRGLIYLKKLGLSNNNITSVKESWFADLPSLMQLDLSYNFITMIESTIYPRLAGLQRLDVSENKLICLEPNALESLRSLDKFRFAGNPLTLQCRGKLTLWLHDRGINYKDNQQKQNLWLDNILWLCALDHSSDNLTSSRDFTLAETSERLIQECVILKLFNQLRTSFPTAESQLLFASQNCWKKTSTLTNCLKTIDQASNQRQLSSGNFIRKLLLHLREFKSTP